MNRQTLLVLLLASSIGCTYAPEPSTLAMVHDRYGFVGDEVCMQVSSHVTDDTPVSVWAPIEGVSQADDWLCFDTPTKRKPLAVYEDSGAAAAIGWVHGVSKDVVEGGATVVMIGDSLTAEGTIHSTVQGHLEPLGVTVTNHANSGKYWRWFRDDAASPIADIVADDPDVVTWLLGVNTIMQAADGDPFEGRVAAEMQAARDLIAMFPPTTMHVIMPPTPCNDRQEAYDHNYSHPTQVSLRDRGRFRRRAQRMVREYVSEWADTPNVVLFSGHTAIHRLDGFPSNNAVHPNAAGYTSLGDAFAPAILWALQNR